MPVTNIDEILTGTQGNSMQPETPEQDYLDSQGTEEVQELDTSEGDDEHEEVGNDDSSLDSEDEETRKMPLETDEYGNEKEPENKEIRERLKKQAKRFQAEIDDLRAQLNEQGASPAIQQAAKDFEYDPNDSDDWQKQLATFVKQTVNNMSREQENERSVQQEQEIRRQFESRFKEGMNKFDDFREVINELPFQISDAMTIATRSMDNPAAFLYAAAKRNPQDLERISKIRDPYAQMTEIGRLEERMRRNKPSTKAPRPLGRSSEDSSLPHSKKQRDSTIEDLIAKADSKKLANIKQRGGYRR
jgi:hypothetical protein